MVWGSANEDIPVLLVVVIPHGYEIVALYDCVIYRSGGDEGSEMEEGEQKKETSVDRHSVSLEI
jgi:hypothetical protein